MHNDLVILNHPDNDYISSVLEELHIYNEVMENYFKNILNVQTDIKK